MTIPPEAIQAAAEAMRPWAFDPVQFVSSLFSETGNQARLREQQAALDLASAALEAALPHLRAEIANDIRADWRLVGPLMAGQPQSAVIEFAARTAEKGTTK